MGETTAISWCDHTFNPWIGCTKVGPACDGCYAEALMSTEGRMKRTVWGKPGQRATHARTAPSNWRQPLKWNREAAAALAAWKATPGALVGAPSAFVFCASLADVFDNDVPMEWRRDLFDLIRATPHLTWLLLTKRPQNIVKLFEAAAGSEYELSGDLPFYDLADYWPRNAAIGCTVVTQAEADRDIPHLLRAKAALKPAFAFLSMEPLLGAVNLRKLAVEPRGTMTDDDNWGMDALEGRVAPQLLVGPNGEWELDGGGRSGPKIDWVITGGETDQGKHRARPSNPAWFRSLRDQCAAADVAYHHKQNGEYSQPGKHLPSPMNPPVFRFDGDPVFCVGKKLAGRLLDGVEHNARPRVSA